MYNFKKLVEETPLTLAPRLMADGSLLLIFRSFSTDDLISKRDDLIASMTTMSSQTVGSKSFTRDLTRLERQLEAVVFVLNERGTPKGYESTLITDFSEVGTAPPRNTIDNL